MKRNLLLLLVLSISVVAITVYMSSCTTGQAGISPVAKTKLLGNCTDSDGGINFYVKGTMIDGPKVGVDACRPLEGPTSLGEYYCDNATQSGRYMIKDCAELGNYYCDDGKCVLNCTNECSYAGQHQCFGNYSKTCGNYDGDPCLEWGNSTNCYVASYCQGNYTRKWGYCATANGTCTLGSEYCQYGCVGGQCQQGNQSNQTCTDSDKTYQYPDGKNPYLRGTHHGYTDQCYGNSSVQEHYCCGSGDDDCVTYLSCSFGCSNGACNNQSNQTCTDSDGGYNLYVQGTCNDGSPHTDYCINSTGLLTEWQCSGAACTASAVSCPSGYSCSQGACIQSNQTNQTGTANFTSTPTGASVDYRVPLGGWSYAGITPVYKTLNPGSYEGRAKKNPFYQAYAYRNFQIYSGQLTTVNFVLNQTHHSACQNQTNGTYCVLLTEPGTIQCTQIGSPC